MAVIDEKSKLSPIEWQALACVAREASKYRAEAPIGKGQEVDLMLRVKGSVDVGVDGESSRAQKPTAEHLLAYLLSVNGEEFATAILEQFASFEGGVLPDVEEGFFAMAKMRLASVTPHKTISRKGSVRGVFRVGQIDFATLAPAASKAIEQSTRAIALEEE